MGPTDSDDGKGHRGLYRRDRCVVTDLHPNPVSGRLAQYLLNSQHRTGTPLCRSPLQQRWDLVEYECVSL